ncbi:hypothetical protein TNCV_5061361 [Trichonephila clavipes]|nr:hypothetical protein TNCV_5061361 [Trichonephila clavipes]
MESDRLSDNKRAESDRGGKGKNICGYIREVRGSEKNTWRFEGCCVEAPGSEKTWRFGGCWVEASGSDKGLCFGGCWCIFDVKDAPRTSRPVVENIDKITEIIEINRHISNRSIAQEVHNDHKRVLSHLRKKLDSKRNSISSNGGQIRTNGQEGSTVYLVGLERNHLLGVASVCKTLNSDLCQQLYRLKPAIDQNWPTEGVVFHQDNSRPQTCSDSPETLVA